ncbi:hypothetical protein Pfo_002696 [Paulownia fortunei]|nr:hypothetical protein Pfo_002696 [Paulownia fortunei]
MVSDSQLVDRLQEILRVSDLETTTAAGVRRLLEEEFSVDLYGRRAFIREQIDLFLQDRAAQNDGAEQEEEVDENAQNDAVVEEQGQTETVSDNENAQEEEISDEEEEKEGEEVSDEERSKRKKSMDTDVKKKGRGFSKPCALSPQLQEFFGVPELARTEVVKKIWAYIREQNLQNPKNRRKILCDESLHGIFRVKSIDMFQMNKALSKHIWPLDEAEATPVKSSQRERQRKQEGSVEPKRKKKPKKGGGSGLTAPLPLSDALVKFFGTGEHELSRADVVKRMWQYIKENELQDPSDKRMVLCDDKLKELFEVDSFHGFTVSKLLTSHFIKTQG